MENIQHPAWCQAGSHRPTNKNILTEILSSSSGAEGNQAGQPSPGLTSGARQQRGKWYNCPRITRYDRYVEIKNTIDFPWTFIYKQ